MAYSSILGADRAPEQPSGRNAQLLGPSDNSDSGSDTIGTYEQDNESTDAFGTGERGAVAGPDVDQIERVRHAEVIVDALKQPYDHLRVYEGRAYRRAEMPGRPLVEVKTGRTVQGPLDSLTPSNPHAT